MSKKSDVHHPILWSEFAPLVIGLVVALVFAFAYLGLGLSFGFAS